MIYLITDRAFNNIVMTPTTKVSFIERGMIDSRHLSPLSKCFSHAINGNIYVVPSVILLLFSCRPFAIFRGITTVVFFSFYAVSRCRFVAHIIAEGFKAIKPPIANSYTSFAVVAKTFGRRVSASLYHRVPCLIQNVTTIAMRCNPVSVEAATRLSAPRFDVAGSSNSFPATFTTTMPSRVAVCTFCSGNYSKTIEFLTDKVDEFAHNILRRYCPDKNEWEGNRKLPFQPLSLPTGELYHE